MGDERIATSQTRHGLRLIYDGEEWSTEDQNYSIGRARCLTICDNPHPMRYRADSGVMMTGYCPGGEEHDIEKGWMVLPEVRGADDIYETLAEAWEALAKALRLRAHIPDTRESDS